MDGLDSVDRVWTAAEFLRTDQALFGDAWKYELVDGEIVAHAAPAPLHAFIHGNLALAVGQRLKGKPCRMEIGAGAARRDQRKANARIPDLLIRCDGLPRVVFEVVSPSELRDWRARNRKRQDEQDIEGVEEIVELYQFQPVADIYRKLADGSWTVHSVEDLDAVIRLRSLGLEVPLAEIYDGVDFDEPDETSA